MTPRKIQTYGWIPQHPDQRDLVMAPADPSFVLPPSVDHRGLMPAVYDQKQLGSCTANMGAAMFQFCALKEAFSDQAAPSRLFIYYNERVIQGTTDTDSGAQCRDALTVLAKQGSIPETEWPYDISQFAVKPSDQCYADASVEKALEYRAVEQNLNAVKAVLASGYPVGFGFTVYESFESQAVAKTGIMPMPAWIESVLGGHAVVRVGYLDNSVLPITLANGAVLAPHDSGGYYIVRNSWGPTWGDAGYFYMPYGADKYSSDFWVLKTI